MVLVVQGSESKVYKVYKVCKVKEKIEKNIENVLKTLGVLNPKVVLEHPGELEHGDYASSVALSYTKELKISPKELAEKIIAEIEKNKPREVEKIEVAGIGFINFYLSKEFFVESVKEIINTGEGYGKSALLNKQKTIIEYTDPNPFKEFHIGHLMSNTIGESISRIVEWNSAEIKRANYQGDVGIHVAKALWGKIKEPQIAWANAYVLGAKNYEENETAKKEIVELNKKIYERSDEQINTLYDSGKKGSLDAFEQMYKLLGTKFDFYFFESETGTFGKEIVEKNIGKVFEESEGAVVFKGEKYNLHTRVFINSEKLPTYEAKELGLAKIKFEKYPYDKSIIITANEVNDYFKVLLKVMELIFPDLAAKTVHISHGMLRLPTGKMSSRTGDVITAESLIGMVKEVVQEKIKDREFTQEEKEDVTEKVAIGAIKYSILKQSSEKDIIFDFEKSLSFEGNSGPYLQYTAARAQSVLHKAETENIQADTTNTRNVLYPIEKLLPRFPEVVERAGKEYAPHYIATYLIELASAFNAFYANETIVNATDAQSPYKVALTRAVKTILKNGLYLLGIPVLERM